MEGGVAWRQAVAPGRTSCVDGTVGQSVELRHWTNNCNQVPTYNKVNVACTMKIPT